MSIFKGCNLFFAILAFSFLLSCKNAFSKKDLDRVNKRLTYLNLIEENNLIVDGKKIDAFMISIDENYLQNGNKEYTKKIGNTSTKIFDKESYFFETGGKSSKVYGGNICNFIDTIRLKDNLKIKEIIEKTSIGISTGLGKFFDLEVGDLQNIIAEIYYVISEASNNNKVEIYLKGYADGSENKSWRKKLDKEFYFDSIDVIKCIDSTSSSPVVYSDIKKHLIKDYYANKDLPNLRAKFIKDVLFGKFANSCYQNINSISILEGYDYTEPNKPENRIVDIVIVIKK
jgi:hypothetical protein